MKFFNREEFVVVGVILGVVVLITSLNLRVAIRRARDSQRRADVGAISNALEKYHQDFGFFPPSTDDGRVQACKGDNFDKIVKELSSEKFGLDKFFSGMVGCRWGEDSFTDVADASSEAYIKRIPQDPKQNQGISYLYLSNMHRFQIYTYLEGEKEEDTYHEGVVKRDLMCGEKVCNYGKAFGETPLDISIDEYETLLEEKRKERQK